MTTLQNKYDFSADWQGHRIIEGDMLQVLKALPSNFFDSVITDPPYCSGSRTMAEKQRSTADKYLEDDRLPDFEGDSKDTRAWISWMSEWMTEARRVLKPKGVIGCFIDWRMYPALSDALQWADFCWRGVFVWDKGEGVRPQKGRFRGQCEYFLYGSKGNMSINRNAPILPGCLQINPVLPNLKRHQTEKPLELMYTLVQLTERGGRILDPFCGSGSTLVAAKHMGFSAVGIEISKKYSEIAEKRLQTEKAQQAIISYQYTTGGGN